MSDEKCAACDARLYQAVKCCPYCATATMGVALPAAVPPKLKKTVARVEPVDNTPASPDAGPVVKPDVRQILSEPVPVSPKISESEVSADAILSIAEVLSTPAKLRFYRGTVVTVPEMQETIDRSGSSKVRKLVIFGVIFMVLILSIYLKFSASSEQTTTESDISPRVISKAIPPEAPPTQPATNLCSAADEAAGLCNNRL